MTTRHYAIRYAYEFCDLIRTTHNPRIGLLKALPPMNRATVTFSRIWDTIETGPTGATRPKYKAYYPGYIAQFPTWSYILKEQDPLDPSPPWVGLYTNLTFTCSSDIGEDSNYSPDVLGWWCYSTSPSNKLLWIEEFDVPLSLSKAGEEIDLYVEMLSRCGCTTEEV